MPNAAPGESVQPIFRAMKADADGSPKVGRSGRELGVRIDGPGRDIPVGADGMVEPRTGGMSVALDAIENLPKPRLPRFLGGEGRDSVFTMFAAEIPVTFVPSPRPLSACRRRARPARLSPRF